MSAEATIGAVSTISTVDAKSALFEKALGLSRGPASARSPGCGETQCAPSWPEPPSEDLCGKLIDGHTAFSGGRGQRCGEVVAELNSRHGSKRRTPRQRRHWQVPPSTGRMGGAEDQTCVHTAQQPSSYTAVGAELSVRPVISGVSGIGLVGSVLRS